MDDLRLTDTELLRQCQVQTFRGTGPGGQKRNKTESAVRLCHKPSGICAQSDDSRSQHENRKTALFRLRRKLALQLRHPVDLKTFTPGPELQQWLATKGRYGKKRPEYLVALSALLDVLVACDVSVGKTARTLGLSTGALSRLLLADEHLAQAVNRLRGEKGLRPLR